MQEISGDRLVQANKSQERRKVGEKERGRQRRASLDFALGGGGYGGSVRLSSHRGLTLFLPVEACG